MFYTKGDNNSAVDFEPVHPEQVKGKIIKVIPKVGWPTLLIKTNKNIDLEGIVFKNRFLSVLFCSSLKAILLK